MDCFESLYCDGDCQGCEAWDDMAGACRLRTITKGLTIGFFVFTAGAVFGYAWAVMAYGVLR